MVSKVTNTQIDPSGPTPEVVQLYISSMLQELSEMANDQGLKNLSSLLQVCMLASSPELKIWIKRDAAIGFDNGVA